MQQKSNDMLLNVMENPSFSIADFQDIGLDVTNTSFQSKDVYQNSPQIQNNTIFQDNKGNFDQSKFNQLYNVAATVYNTMAQQQASKEQDDFKVQYSKYDIYSPEDQTDFAPSFNINTQEINPDRTTYSTVRVGKQGERTKTPQEIAQSQKVYNPATGEWEDSPEDSFFGNFKDVRALAQYDIDVDANGIERGQQGFDENNIEHHAGELKINPTTGTYYYEDLNGRNIHGRQILHLSDVITNEDSPINAIDFLDSDDIQKSAVGSFVKNAALVGAMFIPGGVGAAVTAATILQQAASFGATLGKIATSSDNNFFNYVQGMAEATNPTRTRSEHSQQDMWTMENLFGMIGDTVAQLKQQRMLFEQLPRLVGYNGKVLTEKGQQALQDKFAAKYATKNADAIESKFGMSMKDLAQENPVEYQNALEQLRLMNVNKAALDLQKYMKSYYNVGGVMSKAYMTLLTVNDMYDEAKKAGASDSLAALTTLGYAAAEYGLLSTGLGEWILPELRAARMQNKAILKALTKDTVKAFEIENAKAVTTEAKHKLWSKAINLGKKLFTADYAVGKQATLGNTIKSTMAASLGEGTEEVSEDVLQDFVRTMYNMYNSATGSSSRMHNTDWQGQYLMDFLGGALGGGIANVSINFKTAKSANNLTTEQAAQQLVYLTRNPEEFQKFQKMLDTTEIGNKYLSATKTVTDDNGNIIGYAQGTTDDNQDKAIKDIVRQNISLIQNTLDADGANVDDKSLFDANTLKDLRWQYLYNSTSTAKLIQTFNTLLTQSVKIHNDINNISKELPDQKYKEGSPEYESIQKRLKSKQDELKQIQNQIKDITSGKKATLFMAPALLETTPYVLQGFDRAATFQGFVEQRTGKEFKDVSDNELNTLRNLYQNYTKTLKKDDVDVATKQYLYATRLFSKNFQDTVDAYTHTAQNQWLSLTKIQSLIDAYNNIQNSSEEDFVNLAQSLQDNINEIPQTEDLKTQLNTLADDYQKFVDAGEGVKPADSIDLGTYNAKTISLLRNYLVDNVIAQTRDLDILLGYVSPEIKYTLSNYIDSVKKFINPYINDLFYENADAGVPDEELNKLQSVVSDLDEAKKRLNDMPYTPIMSILDSYGSAINGAPLHVSQLFEKLNSLGQQTKSDVTQFLVSDDISRDINQTLILLDQLQSIVEGARTDNAALTMFDTNSNTLSPKDNIWGINKVLNDIAAESGDDSWEELPTIAGTMADALYTDIQSLKTKLNYYKTLYGINKGQKLNSQNRIAIHNTYLMYKKVKELSDVVPDDWNKSKLDTLLPTLATLEANYAEDNLRLSKEDFIKLRKESIALDDAIYDFFQDNKDKDLSELFNEKTYKIFTENYTLLNETTQNIDQNSFLGLLAAKATIKTSAFLKSLVEILPTTNLVPLDAQIQAIQLNVANIINGNQVSKFITAARKAGMDYFNNLSVQDRFDFCKNTLQLNDTISAVMSTDSGKFLMGIQPYLPLYTNITFVEGTPGAGKSTAVFKLTSEFIKKYYKDVLKGAWIVNTNEDSIDKLNGILNIEDTKGFNRKQLLQHISTWVEPKINDDGSIDTSGGVNRLKLTENGVISTFNLKSITETPKVIFIDEISLFTSDELELLNRFANNNNITIITAGDLDQSQTTYTEKLLKLLTPTQVTNINQDLTDANLKNSNNTLIQLDKTTDSTLVLGIDRNNILHTPKLGTSIRTANTQQDVNQQSVISILEHLNDPKFTSSLTLHYWESDNDIHGTKILSPMSIKNISKSLDKMILHLKDGEKIGYVYYDTKSPIYQAITSQPKYSDHIDLYKGNSAQGFEGKYWIIETNPNKSTKEFLQDLHTGITRAFDGSVLVVDNNYSNGQLTSIRNVKDSNTQTLVFSQKDKQRYTDMYVEVLNSALEGVNETLPQYVERTQQLPHTQQSTQTQQGTQQNTQQNTQQGTQQNTQQNTQQGTQQNTQQNTQQGTQQNLKQIQDQINNDIKESSNASIQEIINKITQYNNLLNNTPDSEVDLIAAYNQVISTLNNILEKRKQAINQVMSTLEKRKTQAINQVISTLNNFLEKRKTQAIINAVQSGVDFNAVKNYSITGNILNFTPGLRVNSTWIAKVTNTGTEFKEPTVDILSIERNDNGSVSMTYKDSTQTFKSTISDLDALTDVDFKNFLNKIFDVQEEPINNAAVATEEEVKTNILNKEQENNDDSGILQKALEDIENKNNQSTTKPTDVFLMDSSKSFELGAAIDDSGNIILSPYNNIRIDGINGLIKLGLFDPKAQNPKTELQKAVNILSKLHGYALTYTSKNRLIAQVANDLGLDKSSTYITFGIKTGEIEENSGNQLNPTSDYHRFDKSKKEIPLYSNNSNTQSINRNLVMIIGEGDTDKLEIPILKLNSPLTKLLQLGILDADTLEEIRNNTLRVRDYLQFILNDQALENHPDVKTLIKFWLATNGNRTIFYIRDTGWTPASSLINLGPQLNINRGFETYAKDQLVQKGKLNPIESILKPTIHISSIMNYIADDGIVSSPGHIFILYTSNPEYVTDQDMINQYVAQQQAKARGDSYNPDVHIKYVSTPEISINEYLNSVIEVVNATTKQHTPVLGNVRTSFLVLKSIFLDKNNNPINTDSIKQLLKDSYSINTDTVYNYIVSKLQNLSELNETDLIAALRNKESWNSVIPGFGFGNSQVSTKLMTIIKQMIAPLSITQTGGTNLKSDINQKNKDLFETLFNNSGQKLYYWAKISKIGNESNLGNNFKKVVVDEKNPYRIPDNIPIQNKQFTIFGDLNTNMYLTDTEGNFNKFMEDWVNKKLQTNNRNQLYSSDNKMYLNGNSNLTSSHNQSFWDSNTKQSFANVPYLNGKIMPNKSSDSFLNYMDDIIKEMAKRQEYPILINNVIYPIKLIDGNTNYTLNNNYTISLQNNNQEFTFDVMGSNGKQYTISGNNSGFTINAKQVIVKTPVETPKEPVKKSKKEPVKNAVESEILGTIEDFENVFGILGNLPQNKAFRMHKEDFRKKEIQDIFTPRLLNTLQKQLNLNDDSTINDAINSVENRDFATKLINYIKNYKKDTKTCSIGIKSL